MALQVLGQRRRGVTGGQLDIVGHHGYLAGSNCRVGAHPGIDLPPWGGEPGARYWGVHPNGVQTVSTTAAHNDGQRHHVVGTAAGSIADVAVSPTVLTAAKVAAHYCAG